MMLFKEKNFYKNIKDTDDGLSVHKDVSCYNNGDTALSPEKVKEIAEKAVKDGVSSLKVEIKYWRKFNALHGWFIDNCADGDNDRMGMFVSHEQIRELCKLLRHLKHELILVDGEVRNGYTFNEKGEQVWIKEQGKVIKNSELAKEFLPTKAGFFFGSYDYDEYYYKNVCESADFFDELVHSDDFEDWTYSYEASW